MDIFMFRHFKRPSLERNITKFKDILQFLIHLPEVHDTFCKSCKCHGPMSSRNVVIAC